MAKMLYWEEKWKEKNDVGESKIWAWDRDYFKNKKGVI